jgi:hypothetical protein
MSDCFFTCSRVEDEEVARYSVLVIRRGRLPNDVCLEIEMENLPLRINDEDNQLTARLKRLGAFPFRLEL